MTLDSLPIPPPGLLNEAALLLDFDGTLVHLIDRPDRVVVDDHLARLMSALAERLGGRLAVVSGRAADDILRMFGGPQPFPVSGSHGMEIVWADGRRDAPEPPGLSEIEDAFDALARRHPHTLVERKPYGVAFHYRAAPDVEDEAVALAAELQAGSVFVVQPGKMMVELRAAGSDKGQAVAALAGAPGMAGRRPLFVGDDLTDEPAFEAAVALGGAGILVGTPRASAARFGLSDVDACRRWLEEEVRP